MFKIVRELNGDEQMVGAISQYLLPYTRANLFNNVELPEHTAFPKLVQSINSTRDLGKLIHKLRFTLPPTLSETTPSPESGEAPMHTSDSEIPINSELFSFF